MVYSLLHFLLLIVLRRKVLLVCAIAFACMCSSCTLKPESYIRYVDSHPAKFGKTIDRNGVVATISWRPAQYWAARDMQAMQGLSADSALAGYSNALHFVATVKYKDGNTVSPLLYKNGPAGYSDQVYTNTFYRNKDIMLVKGTDTVRMADYQYQRNWGVGNKDQFVIMFDKTKIAGKLGSYHLLMRNLCDEIGTIDLKLSSLFSSTPALASK